MEHDLFRNTAEHQREDNGDAEHLSGAHEHILIPVAVPLFSGTT
jgi:hypothetical protein